MPVAANPVTGFGLRLLEQLGPGPVAFSPLSVHACLATLRQGASGETREALDAVLGDDGPPLAVEDPAIRLALAQALWLDPRYRLVPAFAEAAARRGVDCRALDFADPGAPAQRQRLGGRAHRGDDPRDRRALPRRRRDGARRRRVLRGRLDDTRSRAS